MLCMFYFSFWFELSPSPGLLWYDSYATGPSVFPLKRRPSFLSGKRRGSSYGVYDFQFSFFSDDDAEGGEIDFYAWGLGGGGGVRMNGCDTDLQRPANVFNLN